MKKKFKVAVTGSIGSGKSEFCRIAEKFGFVVIRSDEVSKNILYTNERVKKKVVSVFGPESYQNSEPNIKFLSNIVFNDHDKLSTLESILHPVVIQEVKKLSDETLKNNDIVFIESALVYEADIENLFDYIVLITAPQEIRMRRKLNASFTEQDFMNREKNQIPDNEKKKRADFIFVNDKSFSELEQFFKIFCLTLGIPV